MADTSLSLMDVCQNISPVDLEVFFRRLQIFKSSTKRVKPDSSAGVSGLCKPLELFEWKQLGNVKEEDTSNSSNFLLIYLEGN